MAVFDLARSWVENVTKQGEFIIAEAYSLVLAQSSGQGAVISPPTVVLPESNGGVPDFFRVHGHRPKRPSQFDNASPGVEVRIALDGRGRGTPPVVCEIR